jgi:hypothetical protein
VDLIVTEDLLDPPSRGFCLGSGRVRAAPRCW